MGVLSPVVLGRAVFLQIDTRLRMSLLLRSALCRHRMCSQAVGWIVGYLKALYQLQQLLSIESLVSVNLK
jgi:hypothetical protein